MSELRVALVGAGHIADAHLRGWRRAPGCRVAGIFDIEPSLAARRARRLGLARAFGSLEEAMAAADVLDVCTPPATHASIVERAAGEGRHVLVEKPVVTRLADWERLRPLLEASSGRLGVVHNLHFSRGVRRARRWLEAGRIGRLLRLEHRFLTHPAADRMLARLHWSHELPGGRWFETLPHALYLIHALAGPLEVLHVAALTTGADLPGLPADEVAIGFAGADCLASVHYSANCPANRRTLLLDGAEGTIEVDLLSGAARLSRHRDRRWRRALGPGLAESPVDVARALPERALALLDRASGATPHTRLIAAYARHLRDGGPPPTPLAEIDYVVRRCEAIATAVDRQAEAARAAR